METVDGGGDTELGVVELVDFFRRSKICFDSYRLVSVHRFWFDDIGENELKVRKTTIGDYRSRELFPL